MTLTKKSESIERVELHLKHLFDYGINFKERVITVTGEIDGATFDRVEAALTEMESHNRKAITVKINSEGGSVYDAMAIVGRLTRSKCKIVTEGYGAIMSAATLILACGKERRMSHLAWLMWHESSYEAHGKHSELKGLVKQTEKEEQKWAEIMALYSLKSKAFWLKNGVGIDAYFSAEELLELGVVDEII